MKEAATWEVWDGESLLYNGNCIIRHILYGGERTLFTVKYQYIMKRNIQIMLLSKLQYYLCEEGLRRKFGVVMGVSYIMRLVL